MPNFSGLIWSREPLIYFRYPELYLRKQLVHGVFTRLGGVSNPPFDSLNISRKVGDRPEHVSTNLVKIKGAIGAEHLISMSQSHGEDIAVLREGHLRPYNEIPSVDAIITNVPRIALLVKQADCQGVVILDPVKKVAANVHCGWRGNVHNILGKAVNRMKKSFACNGSDMLAAIGPSLGPCCAEFVGHKEIFPAAFKEFMVRDNYFNLWLLSVRQLVQAGLKAGNIELAEICTRCRTDLFYSFRGEGGTGRFGSVAMLL
ncbi:MAG: laccase domain-containing protein [Desulfobacterales bacterium]|nr:laccase domain-containing protein [Desulfobacterales bacterium]